MEGSGELSHIREAAWRLFEELVEGERDHEDAEAMISLLDTLIETVRLEQQSEGTDPSLTPEEEPQERSGSRS